MCLFIFDVVLLIHDVFIVMSFNPLLMLYTLEETYYQVRMSLSSLFTREWCFAKSISLLCGSIRNFDRWLKMSTETEVAIRSCMSWCQDDARIKVYRNLTAPNIV
jgi:hypothetical protein